MREIQLWLHRCGGGDHRSRGTEPDSSCAAKGNLAGRVFSSFQRHQVFTYVLQEQYVVNALCMHLPFLGTQLANLIQILCFPPPLWQRKGFLSLKCDNNKFQSHLLSALSVLWSYHGLMGNICLGSMLKKIVSTLLIA